MNSLKSIFSVGVREKRQDIVIHSTAVIASFSSHFLVELGLDEYTKLKEDNVSDSDEVVYNQAEELAECVQAVILLDKIGLCKSFTQICTKPKS